MRPVKSLDSIGTSSNILLSHRDPEYFWFLCLCMEG